MVIEDEEEMNGVRTTDNVDWDAAWRKRYPEEAELPRLTEPIPSSWVVMNEDFVLVHAVYSSLALMEMNSCHSLS